jgi:hypothetical protein
METGIRNYIQDNFIESKGDLLQASFKLFEDADIESHQDKYIALIMESDNQDRVEIASSFEREILNDLESLIKEHGVIIQEETPLEFKNKILEGLFGIEYYIDVDSLALVLESTNDNEEKLSEMISYIVDVDYRRVLTYIEDVSDSLLERILTIIKTRTEEQKETISDEAKDTKILSHFKSVLKFMNSDKEFIASKLLNAGAGVGSLFSNYVKHLLVVIDELPIEQSVKEIFVLFALAEDTFENPFEAFQKHSDILYHDINTTTKAFSLFGNLISGYTRFQRQDNLLIPKTPPIPV